MKKTICGFLAAIITLSLCLTGCGDKESTVSTDGKTTITLGFTNADETWKEDDYYKYITDKHNIDIDFRTLPANSSEEKVRIWINSGDMPDAVYTYFSMDEYLHYAEQGLVRKMPADFDEKYPNLGFVNSMSGVYDIMKEKAGGDFYAVLRPDNHYQDYIDEFRKAYEDGKDLRKMMEQQEYMYLSVSGFVYRKDWAKQLGIKTDYIMDYDDVMDMALKFKEADLGKVGKENTIAITADYTEAPNIFVTAFNTSYKYFHKDKNGKYVCGLLDKETTEGVKAYAEAYRTGLLSPDFYTLKADDLNSIFCSQRSGIIYPRSTTSTFRQLYSDFEKANPGLKGSDCLGVCWLRSPDGKVHVRQIGNGGGYGWLFNPNISDEKLDAILKLMDYCSSPDGGPQVKLGVPGVDYKYENGEYTITRKKNADGSYDTLNKLYPSYDCFKYMGNTHFMLSNDTNPYVSGEDKALIAAVRAEDLSLLTWDSYRDYYVSDELTKFNATYEVNNLFADVIVADGDVEKLWEEKRAKIAKDAKKIAADMNKKMEK